MAMNFFKYMPVLRCPANPKNWVIDYTVNTIDFAGFIRTGDYIPPSPENENRRHFPKDAAFLMEQPHGLYQFMWHGKDANTWGVWHPGQMTFDASGNPNGTPNMVWSTDRHHDGYTPFAFLDGHVEIRRITPQEIPIQLLNPLAPK
jgi:prepilin-type processing-associated H-X9-DG protein